MVWQLALLHVCGLASADDRFAAEKSQSAAEAAHQGGGEVVDMILASIDGDPVTMSDLKRYIANHGEKVPSDILDGSAEIRKSLRDMVVEELLTREAKTSGISVSDDEVDAYIDEIKRQNRVDKAGLTEILATKGISLADYKVQVRSDIMRTRILGQKVRSKINVLDEDIANYLKEHPERAPKSGEIHIEQIAFHYADGSTDEEREALIAQAATIKEKVEAGKEFRPLGEDNYSDLGFVKVSDLRSDFQKPVSKLKAGEASEPVKVDSGIFLFHVISGSETQEIDPQVKEEIRRELFEARFKVAMEKFINDELPKKYHVELKL